ncbi:hypothetical protein V6Z11_D04G099600 [Gossypium hirsutum]
MAENLMPALQYNNYGGGAASLKGLFYNAVNFCAFYCMLKFRSHLQIKSHYLTPKPIFYGFFKEEKC